MFENPRRGKQARNLTTNVPKILDLKSSSEQVFSENERWVPLAGISLPFFIRRSFLSVLIGYLLVCLFVCFFFTCNYYLCRVWNVMLCFAVEYLCWPDPYWFLACVFNMRVLVWEMYIVEILCFFSFCLKRVQRRFDRLCLGEWFFSSWNGWYVFHFSISFYIKHDLREVLWSVKKFSMKGMVTWVCSE